MQNDRDISDIVPQEILPAPAQESKPVASAPAALPTAKQFQEVEKRMTVFERSTVRWTRAAVGVSILAAIFICLQWWEMHSSSTDTHNLALAADNQAVWTQHLSDNMKTQGDRTQELADRMKDQADRTKTIAEQAIIQARAAMSAAQTANESLHISERAYIVVGRPKINNIERSVTIPIENIGRIPSGEVEIISHNATVNVYDPSIGGRFDQAVDKSCSRGKFEALTPNLPQDLTLPVTQMSDRLMDGGHQLNVIAGTITYDDGLSQTPKRAFQFCIRNFYSIHAAKTFWRSCDAKLHIQALEKIDGYPNCQDAGIDH